MFDTSADSAIKGRIIYAYTPTVAVAYVTPLEPTQRDLASIVSIATFKKVNFREGFRDES